jgi:hypothetical protein
MSWQDIAVIVSVGAAIIYLIGRLFRRGSSSNNTCASCSDVSCPLRDIKSRQKGCDKQ